MLQVTVDGEHDAPPLVMLPSSQRDASDFNDAAVMLAAAGFCVLRPWPRGMASSDAPLEGLSLYTLAADGVFAVQELGGNRPAIWLGHAYGHYIARVADLAHPEYVRGVVVAAAAARTFPDRVPQTLEIAMDPKQSTEARLAALREGFFAPGNDPTSWLRGWHPALRAAYKAASGVPHKSTWWPVTNSPILDLQAAQDPWRPESTRNELRDVLGDKITVRLIENASHALMVEQPRAVADAIIEWERTLPPPKAPGFNAR